MFLPRHNQPATWFPPEHCRFSAAKSPSVPKPRFSVLALSQTNQLAIGLRRPWNGSAREDLSHDG